MNLNGDILIVEDDIDDQEIILEVFNAVLAENKYRNKVVVLSDSSKVITHLKSMTQKPFLLISDINMPKLDGIALREQIFADSFLNRLCTPYLFLTTSGDNIGQINKAFELAAHGYFNKPSSYSGYKELANSIISYWKTCKTPPQWI